MAKKEKLDYKEFSAEELRQRLEENREKLFQMRFQSATAPLKNPKAIVATRREIARLHTFLNMKQKQPVKK